MSTEPLLTMTDDGVTVESKSATARMEGDLAHVDKLLRVCGELGIARDTFIRTSNGESSIGGLVRGAMSKFDSGQEIEWTIEGLARYLVPSPGWANRFGQFYTFDNAVERLVGRKMGTGACFGSRIPYALAVLVRLNERYEFLKHSSHAKAIRYLIDVSRLQGASVLERDMARPLGTGDANFHSRLGCVKAGGDPDRDGPPRRVDCICASGCGRTLDA